MARLPIPTWHIVLVIVRSEDRFLLVQEAKYGQRWFLPAGRVEQGETLVAAAHRETLEEAGIPITIDGILRIEHTPAFGFNDTRLRAIFVAHPLDNTPPKRHADKHSLRAAWVTLAELENLHLRGNEVRALLHHVAQGGAIYPLSLLTFEGAPFS